MMQAYQNLRFLFCAGIFALISGCQKPVTTSPPPVIVVAEENPEWLNERIQEFNHEKPTNPPAKIYQYLFQDQEIYYIQGYCCDVPGKVFTKDGKQLCEPDGGITGRGDGKCPDFFTARTNEKLIWEDIRK